MSLPEHLFVGPDGDLLDTRLPDWAERPIRPHYSWHFRRINRGRELCASLRAGDWTWPGGYPLYFVTDDGGALCADCVRKELYQIIWSIRNKVSDGWRVCGLDVNYEDDLHCDHCDGKIE